MNTRIGKSYPGGVYMPGGRDWQFRHPLALEVTLHLAPRRLRQWLYLHWPIETRRPGTVG